MEKFITINSTAVPLAIEDIDTDQIIPARFLKATSREGLETTCLEIGDMTNKTKPSQTLC